MNRRRTYYRLSIVVLLAILLAGILFYTRFLRHTMSEGLGSPEQVPLLLRQTGIKKRCAGYTLYPAHFHFCPDAAAVMTVAVGAGRALFRLPFSQAETVSRPCRDRACAAGLLSRPCRYSL
jgi:hypothetical protein